VGISLTGYQQDLRPMKSVIQISSTSLLVALVAACGEAPPELEADQTTQALASAQAVGDDLVVPGGIDPSKILNRMNLRDLDDAAIELSNGDIMRVSEAAAGSLARHREMSGALRSATVFV
jgi:hypothetical protein